MCSSSSSLVYGSAEGDGFGSGGYFFGTGFGDEFVENLVCMYWDGLVWSGGQGV